MIRRAIALALLTGAAQVALAAPPIPSKSRVQAPPSQALALEYRIERTGPVAAPIGTMRVLLTPDRTLIVTRWTDRAGTCEHRVLYTRDLCLFRDIEPRADLAQIRPRATLGLAWHVPLFPRGVIGLDMTEPAPEEQGRTTTMIADPAVISYGSIQRYPAETKRSARPRFPGSEVPDSYTLRRDGEIETVWSYPSVTRSGSRIVLGKIVREEFRTRGSSLPADETTVWTLTRVGGRPASDLTEARVLAPGVTTQDNRDPSDPVAFSYDPKGGALDVQSDSERAVQGTRESMERARRKSVWIPAALLGLVVVASVVLMGALLQRPRPGSSG